MSCQTYKFSILHILFPAYDATFKTQLYCKNSKKLLYTLYIIKAIVFLFLGIYLLKIKKIKPKTPPDIGILFHSLFKPMTPYVKGESACTLYNKVGGANKKSANKKSTNKQTANVIICIRIMMGILCLLYSLFNVFALYKIWKIPVEII